MMYSSSIHEGKKQIPNPVVHLHEAPFPDNVIKFCKRKHFMQPTRIQAQVWPLALKGYDIAGIAETGSGGTLAYALPMLKHVGGPPEVLPGEGPIGLVIVPCRGLGLQIAEVIGEWGKHTRPCIECRTLVGGAGFEVDGLQQSQFSKADVVVCTPGKLIGEHSTGKIKLDRATYFVLDEADQFLNEYTEQVQGNIIPLIRPDKQA